MTPIPTSFAGTRDQRGFQFTMLKRNGRVALFEKFKTEPRSGKSYEVVLLQHSPKKTWPDGRVTEAHEKMPKPEDWGVLGWSSPNLATAESRFNSLVLSRKGS